MGRRSRRQLKMWDKKGRYGPPHIVKQCMVLEYAKTFGIDTLVETGTYLGDMVYAMKDRFRDIYSIELSDDLHSRAQKSFKRYHHIHLLPGDSGAVLPKVLDQVTGPCLFWLDGHYSGGITALGDLRCPVRKELDAICRHPTKNHVILIDDAICFDGRDGYPTLFELRDIIRDNLPAHEITLLDNVIRIAPTEKPRA